MSLALSRHTNLPVQLEVTRVLTGVERGSCTKSFLLHSFSFISLRVCTAKGIGASGRVKLFLDLAEDQILSLKKPCLS